MDNKTKPDFSKENIVDFISGSDEAFGKIFHFYSDRVFNFCNSLLHSRNDAEEITQEVFVKLWESRKSVDPSENFNAFVFTIARNIIFNRHKKKVNEWKYLDHLKNHLSQSNDETGDVVLLDELKGILEKHIRAMPPKRRKVFELSRFKGLSHKEISKELNISTKTIEIHISKALKELRVALKDYYVVLLMITLLS